jgi:transcription initiation factor TFIID subunit 1
MSNAATTAPLDFAAVLSKNYRPARASRLIAKEAYLEHEPSVKPDDGYKKKEEKDDVRDEEVSKLVMQLVSETPAFSSKQKHSNSFDTNTDLDPPPRPPENEWETLPSALHAVELDDWEKRIDWDGVKDDEPKEVRSRELVTSDAASLLAQRRNPELDALVFDESNICWDGSREDAMEKARNVKLLLERGTAGQSIARRVVPVDRPPSFQQSDAYLRRFERELSTPVTSSAELSKGTLHADRDKLEAVKEARERKRKQLEIDKNQRVTEAMGTLSILSGGKGRTITSSLMGPGGTERTGRPSRLAGSSSHDLEVVDQLDFVYNHSMVQPELSKAQLRQFHRPKLPSSIVRSDLPWQFQILFAPSTTKADAASMIASSYQSMMGSHPGATSQSMIKRESDLSPSEGNLVLLEYSEERPPIQLTKGMASKIINYYRGDKSRCPISAGGGDRPTRKKRHETTPATAGSTTPGKEERSTRLVGPSAAADTTVMDWIGKPPKKKSSDERAEKPSIDMLPEGITEILHKNVHGPFIGDVEDGVTQTGIISNLFVAPMFRHEAESTDFLMVLGSAPTGDTVLSGPRKTLGVVLRPLPSSVYTVGQTEPRIKVQTPGGNKEKEFTSPFFEYHIAKLLKVVEDTEGRGMRSEEIIGELFPDAKITSGKNNTFRPRMKNVADCEGNTYTLKSPAEFPGVEALGKRFSPESVAAYETACAASRRLHDLGIVNFESKGASNVVGVGIAIVYLNGQVNALRELSKKMRKMVEIAKSNKSNKSQIAVYENAANELEAQWKESRRILEVARFIYEELQLTPWNLTTEFIDVHKGGAGTGMMKLTGVGDPSGRGEGFNFVREEAKSNKTTGNTDGALNAQIKKITGTDNDLRRLTMKQMASLLRSYGMDQKKIDTLKRWDRVHVIRDLSTKAASDGMGDGLERFARGEKMKLSEQKQQYRDRVQEIWRRQRAALSSDPDDVRATDGAASGAAPSMDTEQKEAAAEKKEADKEVEDSDSDADDDDLMAMLEEDMADVEGTNEIVKAYVRGEGGGDGTSIRGQPLPNNASELTTDAQALAALKRDLQEEQVAKKGMSSDNPAIVGQESMLGRKVVRKRVTKTFPDGRQTTTFKFIVLPAEVDKVIMRKSMEAGSNDQVLPKKVHKSETRRRQIGHAMFEEEDEGRSGARIQVHRTTRTIKGTRGVAGKHKPRLGKLKSSVSQENRNRKRLREADEADLYVAPSKRKGTSNRRERGSARDRMPHVVFANRLEGIRSLVERRPHSVPFHKPVNRRAVPRYYEVISNPIDLSTIREKIHKYVYPNADAFLRDFELMKNNAIRFNTAEAPLSKEAVAIYEFVKSEINDNRAELEAMVEAVENQLNNKKPRKGGKAKAPKPGGANVMVDGVPLHLGDLPKDFVMLGPDSDSD